METTNYQTLAQLLQTANVKGTAQSIQNIFNYHYDQILREVEQEVANLPGPFKQNIIDHIVEDMENSWPYSEDELIQFNK